MKASQHNIEQILLFVTSFAQYDTFKLRKVWFDEKSNSIKARFGNEVVGGMQGTISLNFAVRSGMSFERILENVTLEELRPSDLVRHYTALHNRSFQQ